GLAGSRRVAIPPSELLADRSRPRLRPGVRSALSRRRQHRRHRPGSHFAHRVRAGRRCPRRPRSVPTRTVLSEPVATMIQLPWHLAHWGSLQLTSVRGEQVMATTTNGQVRKTLASQLDRLDSILDALSDGLNEAVATAVEGAVERAVRQAVGQAVKETMQAVL